MTWLLIRLLQSLRHSQNVADPFDHVIRADEALADTRLERLIDQWPTLQIDAASFQQGAERQLLARGIAYLGVLDAHEAGTGSKELDAEHARPAVASMLLQHPL